MIPSLKTEFLSGVEAIALEELIFSISWVGLTFNKPSFLLLSFVWIFYSFCNKIIFISSNSMLAIKFSGTSGVIAKSLLKLLWLKNIK